MTDAKPSLADVFAGWADYQTSLVHAIRPLTPEQLAFRPAAYLRSVGELAAHISFGRFQWFERMGAPGSAALAREVAAVDSIGAIERSAEALVRWLEATWGMIAQTLKEWTVADLEETYRHEYQNQVYAISRQWTIWRIMAHDLHHGGQLAIILGMQGIAIPELGDLGGHLTFPPLAEE
jgi:uncharacterized damage-inducible protein DinB